MSGLVASSCFGGVQASRQGGPKASKRKIGGPGCRGALVLWELELAPEVRRPDEVRQDAASASASCEGDAGACGGRAERGELSPWAHARPVGRGRHGCVQGCGLTERAPGRRPLAAGEAAFPPGPALRTRGLPCRAGPWREPPRCSSVRAVPCEVPFGIRGQQVRNAPGPALPRLGAGAPPAPCRRPRGHGTGPALRSVPSLRPGPR